MVAWDAVRDRILDCFSSRYLRCFVQSDNDSAGEPVVTAEPVEPVTSSRGDFSIAQNQNHGAVIPVRPVPSPRTLRPPPAPQPLQPPPARPSLQYRPVQLPLLEQVWNFL